MAERAEKVTRPFGTLGNVNIKERTFEAWSSVPDVDRDREYVPISAFEKLLHIYKENPVLLLGHQHKTTGYESLPIGKCIEIEPRDEGLWTKFYVSRRPIGNEILTLLDEGILKGLSSGFIPVDFIPNPSDHELPTFLRGKGLKKYYKEVELVEISLLSIPSNRKSLVIHAQKGNRVADMVMKEFRGEDVTYVIKEWLSEEKAVDPYKKHLWLGFTLQPESRTALGNVDVEGKKVAEEELHLTLRYFGDVENMGDVDDVRDALLGLENTLATTYDLKPVDYEILKDDSLVARYSNGAISELHEKANNLLKSNTLNFPEEFSHLDGHVTLAIGEGLTPPVEKPPSAQTGELRLMWGKDEVIHNFTPHQIAWNTFVSKVFGWNEAEHPRDDGGQFSSKIGDVNFDTERNPLPSRPWYFSGQDPKSEEINNKLDSIIGGQRGIATNVEAIKNQDSWGNWAKKWAIRIGVLAGAYYGIKHIAKSPEARQKVVGWLKDSGLKEFKGEDTVDKLLHILDLTKAALAKGESLGAINTSEYKKLEIFYNKAVTSLSNVGKTSNEEVKINKGLGQLWVVTKEMTPETFVEEEHPRAVDGKFRNKADTSGTKKVKVEHVDESHEIPDVKDHKGKSEDGNRVQEDTVKEVKKVRKKTQESGWEAAATATVIGSIGLIALALQLREHRVPTLRQVRLRTPDASFGDRLTQTLNETLNDIRSGKPRSKSQWDKKWGGFGNKEHAKDYMKAGPIHQFDSEFGLGTLRYPMPMSEWRMKTILGHSAFRDVEKDKLLKVYTRFAQKYERGSVYLADRIKRGARRRAAVEIDSAKKAAMRKYGLHPDEFNQTDLSKVTDLNKFTQAWSNYGSRLSAGREVARKTEQNALTKAQETWKVAQDLYAAGHPDSKRFYKAFIKSHSEAHRSRIYPEIEHEYFSEIHKWDRKISEIADEARKRDNAWRNRRRSSSSGGGYQRERQSRGGGSWWERENYGGGERAKTNMGTEAGPEVSGWEHGRRFNMLRERVEYYLGKISRKEHGKQDVDELKSTLGMFKMMNKKLKEQIDTGSNISKGKEAYAFGEKAIKAIEDAIADLIKKGFTFLAPLVGGIVAKDWTEEDEREHPRAPEGSSRGGEFVSKNEPTSEGGAWGGVRKNAGRTSKNPIIARQRLEERFKKENPQVTDEELKQKIIEHAVEKKNPDLYLHMTDPEAYQKKREQEIVEAMASKPSRNKIRGQTIDKVDDPAGTSIVLNDIKTTRAAWNRELTQAKDIHEAWKTFHEKNPEELDLARAKLITAAASVATLVGLGVLLAKRPNLRSAGFKFLPGAESGAALPMDAKTGLVDYFVRDHPTWVRFFKNLGVEGEHSAKAAGMGDVVYEREIGALRKWAAKKLNVKDPNTGELLYPFAGPKLAGYGPGSRYGIKDYHTINGMSSNYVPTPGDANEYGDILVTQLREKIAREGKATAAEQVGWDYINLAVSLKRLPKNPREWKGPHPPGLRVATDENGKAYWAYKGGVSSREGISQRLAAEPKISPSGSIDADKAAAKAKLVTGESIFKKYLAGDIKGGGKFNRMSNEAILDKTTLLPIRKPSKVLRPIPDEAKAAFNAKAEAYKSNAHAFTKNVLPQLSGRSLGMLTVTSGVAGVAGAAEGIYYFQQDIERYLSGYFKHKEEQAKAAAVETPSSKQTEAERIKAQMALLKQQQKLAEAQGNAAERKTVLEDRRAKLRQELVDMGVRRYAEGAVPMWAANPETFFRRLHDTGMLDNEGDIRRVSEIMLGEDRRKAARLIEELDGMPLTRNRAWWKKWDQQTWDEKAKGTFWEQEGYTESDYHKAQREARENAKRAKSEETGGTKGASGLDLIIKMFEPPEATPLAITFKAIEIKEDEPFDEKKFQDDAITALAEHIARMISDISQSCKTVIQAGMPGMSEYVELNNIVTEVYAYLKDIAKNSPQEVSQKGFENVMSSQVDAGGGLFAEPRRCRICGRTVTEDLILKCKKAGCPFSFLEKIENKD